MTASPQSFMLYLATCIAVAVAGVGLLFDRSWVPPEAQIPDLGPSSLVSGMRMPGLVADIEEIAARPLFLPGRRPYVEPVAQPEVQQAAEPDPFPDAELVGIFGSGREAGVMLRHENKTERVRVGAEWSGWKLDAVDMARSSARFSAAGRGAHEVKLKRQPQQGALVFEPPQRTEPAPEAVAESAPAAEPAVEQPEVEVQAQPRQPPQQRQARPANRNSRDARGASARNR